MCGKKRSPRRGPRFLLEKRIVLFFSGQLFIQLHVFARAVGPAVVALHAAGAQQLDDIRAVENFDPEIVTCEQGDSKKAVLCVVNGLNVVNAMAQLYMSVIIQ